MRFIHFLLVAVVLLVVLAACGTAADTPEDFRHISTWEDGRAISVGGADRGHRAGETSTFEVIVQNKSDEAWQNAYCLLLVDDVGIVSQLAGSTFDLVPDDGVRHTVEVTLPEGVEDGTYGLMMLVPSLGSLTGTVVVGDASGEAGRVAAPIGGGCATGNLPDAEFAIDSEPFTGDLTPQPAE